MGTDIGDELKRIEEKLDQLIRAVDELLARKRAKASARRANAERLPPVTEQEVVAYQATFQRLFDLWMTGKELEVERELSALDREQLRRFGDANNLNVTSRMPSQKVMQLIGARFREKRQLLAGMKRRPEKEAK